MAITNAGATSSAMWQTLKGLRPCLPRHVDLQPRNFRGERWYVLHDKSSGRYHRLSPTAHKLIGLMNGQRSLADILTASAHADDNLNQAQGHSDAPATEQELIDLLQYLHVADLLVCDMPPNTQELFARQQSKRRKTWTRLLLNPVSWKIPCGNPNQFLNRLLPLARLLANPTVGVVWLLVVGYALLQAGAHWSELSAGKMTSLLTPVNLLLLWLTYPVLKVLHELGHGLFTKLWGGEVNECGIVFVAGIPLPYVDATAATGFRTKAQRLMVGAAGMAVELFLAAVALLLWLNVEDGLVKSLLYNVMILGSVSTLFFNGNPLLKFDGYHLLCDLIEIPNLGARANQQISYLIQRYGYGIPGLYSPAATTGEALGFTLYGVAAFVYRLLVLALIVYLIAGYSVAAGAVLGLWLVVFQLLLPLARSTLFLFHSHKLDQRRKRAISISVAALVITLALFFLLPLPLSTQAEGVMWLPAESQVRAGAEGEVATVLVADGEAVQEGQPLLQLRNPALITDLQLKQAVLKEYQARYQQAWAQDRSQVNLLMEDINAIQAEIVHLQGRVNNLEVRSPAAGRITFTQTYNLRGSYLHQGDALGFVVQSAPARIRVALTQEEIGLVRGTTRAVQVRLAQDMGTELTGQVTQEVPEATFTLPSPVLGAAGGGRLAISADNPDSVQTTKMVFLLDVVLPQAPTPLLYGERAYVLFRHPPESLAAQLYRRGKQLFISTLRN